MLRLIANGGKWQPLG